MAHMSQKANILWSIEKKWCETIRVEVFRVSVGTPRNILFSTHLMMWFISLMGHIWHDPKLIETLTWRRLIQVFIKKCRLSWADLSRSRLLLESSYLVKFPSLLCMISNNDWRREKPKTPLGVAAGFAPTRNGVGLGLGDRHDHVAVMSVAPHRPLSLLNRASMCCCIMAPPHPPTFHYFPHFQ